uniref:Uncharacterized protein n=1 Tax=Arundo donax TaxID=35708 RepID=A0A0A9DG47_ARUDO
MTSTGNVQKLLESNIQMSGSANS